MLTRILAGAAFCATLLLCAPAKAQDPAGVQGDPATTNHGATSETIRANNRADAKERRAENKRISKEHKAELKRANHERPRGRKSHAHGPKAKKPRGTKRTNPNKNSNPRKQRKTA